MDESRRKTIALFKPPPLPVPSPVLSLTVQHPEFNEPNPEDLPYCPKTIEMSPGHPLRSHSPGRVSASPISDRSMNLGNVVKEIKEGRPSLFGKFKNKLR